LSVSVGGYPLGAGNAYPLGETWWSIDHEEWVVENPYNSSYYFIGWSVDGSTTLNPSYPLIDYNEPYAFVTVNQNHALVAYFFQNSSGRLSLPICLEWYRFHEGQQHPARAAHISLGAVWYVYCLCSSASQMLLPRSGNSKPTVSFTQIAK
jgi:hypothetical protein